MAYAKDSEVDMTPATSEESVGVPDPSGRMQYGRHPMYEVMIKRAIIALRQKRGTSSKAIKRYICTHFIVKKTSCRSAVARTLKRMIRSGYVYRNKRNLYKLTQKGRKLKPKRRRRRRRRTAKKGGRRRRRRRGKKGGKKGKKSKKGRKGRRRRRRRARKHPRAARRRRKARHPKRTHRRRRGRRARKGGRRRRRH